MTSRKIQIMHKWILKQKNKRQKPVYLNNKPNTSKNLYKSLIDNEITQKNSEYSIKCFSDVNEINKQAWDEILAENELISSYAFIKALSESAINVEKYFYLVVYKKGQIIAHTYTYIIRQDLMLFQKGWMTKLVSFIKKIFPYFLMIKAFECGCPVGLGKTIVIRSDPGIDKEQVLNIITDKIEELGRKEKADLLIIRDIYKKEPIYDKIFCQHNFIKANNLPDVQIRIRWQSFEQYQNDLRYNYRRFVKKCFKTMQTQNIKVEYVYEFSNLAIQLKSLYQNCYENANELRREILTKEFFQCMDKYLLKKTMVILLKKQEKLIGFAFFLLDNDIARLVYVGMDYKEKKSNLTYFNLFYQGLKFAIEQKYKKLELGITSYEFKIKMGGELLSLYAYLKHFNKTINRILHSSVNLLFPVKELASRHPFKDKNEDQTKNN